MSGTHLYYNGILMRDCKIDEYVDSIEYDESGVDPLYSRIRITAVSSLVAITRYGIQSNPSTVLSEHPSTIGIDTQYQTGPAAPDVDFTTAVGRLKLIEERLQQPRKDFWLAVHAATRNVPANFPIDDFSTMASFRIVLAATGEQYDQTSATSPNRNPNAKIEAFAGEDTDIDRDTVLDSNSGPRPISARATFVGGQFIRVELSIEICRCLCEEIPGGEGAAAPVRDARKVDGVISNKWSVTESIDQNWATTHTIDGTLVVKDQRFKAMAMRTMVHPRLFPYAKLESREFTVDKTGLKLGYRFTIKERGSAPPPGLVDWDGTYTESSGPGTGNQIGSLSLRVRGPIARPAGMTAKQQKSIMLRALYAIAESRISGINGAWNPLPGQNNKTAVVKDGVVIEKMGQPELELRISVQYSSAELNEFNLRLENMGKELDIDPYNPMWWPQPEFYQWDIEAENADSRLINEEGSYLEGGYNQSPCSLYHSMPRNAMTDKIGLAIEASSDGSTVPMPKTFRSYMVKSIYGADLKAIDSNIVVNAAASGLNIAEQLSGFPYLQWDSEVRYNTQTGKIQLPLSKARLYPGGSAYSGVGLQTAVVVKLHAGMAQRVYKVIATRQGQWPKVPAPLLQYASSGNPVEELIDQQIISETPKLDSDHTTMQYSIQVQWVYALSRPPDYGFEAGGPGALKVGASPICMATPANNSLPFSHFYEVTKALDA